MSNARDNNDPEPLFTLKEIAARLNLPEYKVTRAAASKLFRTYCLFNKRKLARLSEVVAAVEQSRVKPAKTEGSK